MFVMGGPGWICTNDLPDNHPGALLLSYETHANQAPGYHRLSTLANPVPGNTGAYLEKLDGPVLNRPHPDFRATQPTCVAATAAERSAGEVSSPERSEVWYPALNSDSLYKYPPSEI